MEKIAFLTKFEVVAYQKRKKLLKGQTFGTLGIFIVKVIIYERDFIEYPTANDSISCTRNIDNERRFVLCIPMCWFKCNYYQDTC